MTKRYLTLESPLGELFLCANEEALTEVRFAAREGPCEPDADWQRGSAVLGEAARQLERYFAGELLDFDLPLSPGGTDFMRAVWSELRRIPLGTTITYGELARRIGKPSASRAVGAANGRNPIPIIVPCHRVIGADGSLTGFSGGLDLKRRLLQHEQGSRATRTTFLPTP
jgi:methylated-DNA-[protein]-cysteine S-methyltransferase